MAATVLIRRATGAGPTLTDITSINTRVAVSDSHTTAGTSNPIPIPVAGTNYSFWASTRLDCTVAPSGTIDTLRWYSDGASFGTGVTVNGQEATSYVQATSAIQLTTGNHAGITGAAVNVTTLTSGSPKTLAGSTSGTGAFGSYFVYQLAIGSTAGPGATAANTLTWKWDET